MMSGSGLHMQRRLVCNRPTPVPAPRKVERGNSSLEKGESGFEQGKLRSVDVAQLNASPDPPFLKREVHMEGLAQLTADEDAPRVSEEAGSVLRREWGLENRFVVGYSGNLGRAHEYRTLSCGCRVFGG